MRNKATTLHPFEQARRENSRTRLRRPMTARQSGSVPAKIPLCLPVNQLSEAIRQHLLDFSSGTYSPRTTEKKQVYLSLFQRFIESRNFSSCDAETLKMFFVYLNESHKDPQGRWGNGRASTPLKPSTIDTHYRILCAFFNWLVKEERITESPLKKFSKPKVPEDQIQPFTSDQIAALLKAAKNSRYPKRDYALVALFYDTGLRVSELCNIRIGDIDFQQKSILILGKGNKKRMIYLDDLVMSALTSYLQDWGALSDLDDDEFIFVSQRGSNAGEPMQRNAVYKLIRRLGEEAGIKNVRCSPHTLRHSFAIATLRQGREMFSLQTTLGHTTLTMTRRYVALSEADLKHAHEKSSPMAGLKKMRRSS